MNKSLVLVVVTLVIAMGVSSFVLTSSNTDVFSSIIQEPVVLEEKISVLDTANPFSAPLTIAQSMKAAQPAPNVTIGAGTPSFLYDWNDAKRQLNVLRDTVGHQIKLTIWGNKRNGPIRVKFSQTDTSVECAIINFNCLGSPFRLRVPATAAATATRFVHHNFVVEAKLAFGHPSQVCLHQNSSSHIISQDISIS